MGVMLGIHDSSAAQNTWKGRSHKSQWALYSLISLSKLHLNLGADQLDTIALGRVSEIHICERIKPRFVSLTVRNT
jgi:hypothetical protein